LITFLALIGGSYAFLRVAWRASGGGHWDDRGRFAIATGALSFFVLLAPLTENDPSRLDNPAGMTLVALFTFVALVLIRRRIHRREQTRIDAA
jgi:peptidoglycan/LPS O-acetylase OafA/YrhL